MRLLFVMAGNVVINVVAGDSIKAFIFIRQMDRVALLKPAVRDTFRHRVVLAAFLCELGLIRTGPDITAHHRRLRVPLCTGDGQRAAAAANIQPDTPIRQFYVFCGTFNDRLCQLPLSVIVKRPVQRAHPHCKKQQDQRTDPCRTFPDMQSTKNAENAAIVPPASPYTMLFGTQFL